MRLGSDEHYGWDRPRTARLMHVFAGPAFPDEFAWLQVPEGAKGGRLDVMVRPRYGPPRWRQPSPGERVQVASWTLSRDTGEILEVAVELDLVEPWAPPSPLPDQWLWVEG